VDKKWCTCSVCYCIADILIKSLKEEMEQKFSIKMAEASKHTTICRGRGNSNFLCPAPSQQSNVWNMGENMTTRALCAS